jgi:hypothetical protein
MRENRLLTGLLVLLDPGRESKWLACSQRQRRARRDDDWSLAGKLGRTGDDAVLVDARRAILPVVTVGGEVFGGLSGGIAEMIGSDRVGVVGARDIRASRRRFVSEVEPELALLAAVHIGHVDPECRQSVLSVEPLDMERKRCLAVRVHDAQIRTVFQRVREREVARIQPYEQDRAPDRARLVRAGWRSIDGHYPSIRPILVPPTRAFLGIGWRSDRE